MTLVSNLPDEPLTTLDAGLRPVNLRTDLAELADLIELVFARTMDESGRAAIREMRYMSRMGVALGWLGRLNDLALGISLGYVWIEDGRLVGNVSIYPASLPRMLGETWIIANVGVHPSYQRRGIARRLMQAALEGIAQRGSRNIILQVDYDNYGAIDLYLKLGFVQERAFTTWSRSSLLPPPRLPDANGVFITQRRPNEWRAEYALAQHVRPAERGGLGWMRPLHEALFHKGFWAQLIDWLTMNSIERLIVRSEDGTRLRAVAWLENNFASARTKLTLMSDPDEDARYTDALLSSIVRRFRTTSLNIEHPYDDDATNELLRKHRFLAERSVWHMRYRG